MSTAQFEIQLIAVVVATACALPGTFLVLRRMAMLSDAISHAILPGIVVAFFLTRNLSSPLLLVGAALTGVITVAAIETLLRTGRLRQDAAIGLTFPVFFAFGVILVSRYAGDVHLDTDAVLLGELAFAPFNRLSLVGIDLGPQALWAGTAVLLVNLGLGAACYKELKVSTFDAALAGALGFSPALLHYGLTTAVSLTAVAAFDAVGSVLVVALMVAPPAAAYLLTDRLAAMLGTSVVIAVASALSGFWLAVLLDTSIAGAIASVTGLAFLLALMLAPDRGLLAAARRRRSQKRRFALLMLALHLAQHEAIGDAADENRVETLHLHLGWDRERVARVVDLALRDGLVEHAAGLLALTEAGRHLARTAVTL